MDVQISNRLAGLTGYAFAEVDKKVAELKASGVDVIDFGVGDPTEPTHEIIRSALKKAVDERAGSGYPEYAGSKEFRDKISAWSKKRFGITLDPDTEICAAIGAKEAVFNFPEAIINPSDVVLVPNPGYPPYTRGTLFAEGRVHYMNLLPKNNFLPDIDAIPEDARRAAKIMWLNYPNNPTGRCAPMEFYKKAIEFGSKYGIIVASDEAYTENYYEGAPHSALEFAKEGVVVFQSLSKRSCMTCYRVGWVAGDKRIVSAFKKLKTNIDSGTPTFIQDGAIAALSDEGHVEGLRNLYRQKRDIILSAFEKIGLDRATTEATLYVWQRIPKGMSSIEFAKKLLDPKIAIVTTPGNWISFDTPEGNPGEGFVRLALVPSVKECHKAAERIREFFKF